MPSRKKTEGVRPTQTKASSTEQIRHYQDMAAAIASAHAIEILSCFEDNDALGTSDLEDMINSKYGLTDEDGDIPDGNTQAVYGSKLRNPLMKLQNVGVLRTEPKNDGTRAVNFLINKEALNDYREFLNRLA